jgi:hypothetical protein
VKTRLVPLVLVFVLATAACGSKNDKAKTAKSDTSTSTSVAGDVTSTTSAAATGAATTVKAGVSATTVKGATVTTTKATTSNGVPTPATPGTYDYTQSGTSSLGNPPASGYLKVDAANAAGVQVWHLAEDPSQPANTNDTTMAFRADGPFLTQTVQRAAGMTITCAFNPPVPAPPWPATTGKPITGHANCGQLTADVNGSITGKKNVTLDGKSIEVVVASVTITTHGQIESTSTQEQWWAPSLRIPTHTHTVTRGTYGAFAFNSDITTDLKSGTPR